MSDSAVSAALNRIGAMMMRYLYLHKRSIARVLELVFWPVMELFVWGFVTLYLRRILPGTAGDAMVFLISAMIFWDMLYRSQQGVSISIIEDMWTHNILNIFISPLRIWEWLAATFFYGLAKTLLILTILTILAATLYNFNIIDSLGLALIPLVGNLIFFGWTLGVFTSALLIRWGHAVEALIWGIPFLIQPFSAIFYPLSVLPDWLQRLAKFIPSTYVFEGMRAVIQTGRLDAKALLIGTTLNAGFFLVASLFFALMYRSSRATGRLGRLGMD